jgi:hypothetical protein
MLTRRRFLKIFGLASLALSFLPSISLGSSSSKCSEVQKSGLGAKNWLHGSPRKGCSSPNPAFEYRGKGAEGLRGFADLGIPPEFDSQVSYEHYMS